MLCRKIFVVAVAEATIQSDKCSVVGDSAFNVANCISWDELLIRVECFLREKLDTCLFVQKCYRTPIPKFYFKCCFLTCRRATEILTLKSV